MFAGLVEKLRHALADPAGTAEVGFSSGGP